MSLRRFILIAALVASSSALTHGDDRKAVALAAPRPIKSSEASQRHLAGSGVFVLQVDNTSGKVTSVRVEKSTGQRLLDDCAVQAFQNWRCRPGTVSKIKIPVIFTATEDGARY